MGAGMDEVDGFVGKEVVLLENGGGGRDTVTQKTVPMFGTF